VGFIYINKNTSLATIVTEISDLDLSWSSVLLF